MRRKTGVSLGVGGSSILVIFVLLCLTTFATLSLVSANADLKLTRKTADAAEIYYTADTRAEELLARVDGVLLSAGQGGAGGEAYWDACRDGLASVEGVAAEERDGAFYVDYTVPVNEYRQLEVSLRVNAPDGAERYTVVRWQDVNVGEWQEDDSLSLWDGGLANPTDFNG